jgi:DNA-nicking Smr family endonuclease
MSRRPHDFDLWNDVARTVKPLGRRKQAVNFHGGPKPKPLVSAPHVHVPHPPHKSPPPITGLDRRMAQKMSRGKVEIERRIDLHGASVELARVQLLRFLRDAHGDGVRTILVITGKGASPFSGHTLHGLSHFHSPERQGRLRRMLPEWLHEAEFRLLVSGYQPAHPRHGGGGAFYLRLRRQRT